MKKYGSISPEFEAQAGELAEFLAEKHPGKATDEAIKAFEDAKKAQPES